MGRSLGKYRLAHNFIANIHANVPFVAEGLHVVLTGRIGIGGHLGRWILLQLMTFIVRKWAIHRIHDAGVHDGSLFEQQPFSLQFVG